MWRCIIAQGIYVHEEFKTLYIKADGSEQWQEMELAAKKFM